MTSSISRRALLAGSGCLGAAGLLRTLPVWAQGAAAAPASIPPVCLSMYYMSGNDAKFDRMQYREKHVALLREIYPGRPVRCALLWTAVGDPLRAGPPPTSG